MKGRCRRVALAVAFAAGTALAQDAALKPLQLTPEELTWTASPRGFDEAVLLGDPAKAGTYVARVRFPPQLKVMPHAHPDDRVVTVLSGTLYMGYGDQWDESKLRRLPAGSVWTEPARQPHFVWVRDGEVIVEVIGHGPSGVIPVAPQR